MAGPITIAIIGDNRKLDSALASSEGRLGRFGRTAGKVGKAVAVGLVAAAAGAALIGAKLITAGEAASTSNARIEQISTSMGLFGKETDAVTGRLIKLAETTALQTGIDQNSIKATQAKLLTFKELGKTADTVGGNFDRATNAAIDLASAGFGAAETNAAQLGKALNDPVKGLTALTRSGVTFTKAEQDRIKTLVESGRMGKAQETILKAIETQVGGTAKATANASDQMKVGLSQLAERAGGVLLPAFNSVVGFLISKGIPAIERAAPVVADLAKQAGSALAPALKAVGGFVREAAPVVLQLATSLLSVYAAVASNVLPALQSTGTYLVSTFGPIFTQVGQIVTGQLLPAVGAVAGFMVGQLLPIVGRVAAQVGTNLRPILDQLASTLQGKVLPAVTVGGNKLREWWPTIQKVIVVVAKLVGGALVLSSAILGKVLPVVIRFTAFLAGNLVSGIVLTVRNLASGVGAVIGFGKAFVNGVQDVARFAQGVRDKVGNAIAYIREIPGRIRDVFSNAGTLLNVIGGQIIDGLKAGISAGAERVLSAVRAIIDKIPKFIRDKLGISSPSKVMASIAKWIPAGIVQGIHSGSAGVKASMERVGDLIADAFHKRFDKKIDPKRLRGIMAGFEGEAKRLDKLAGKYAKIASKLAGARDLAAAVAGSARDWASITDVGVNADGTQTAQSITQGLRDRLDAIKTFAANVDKLRKQGLSKGAIDQIIADGVEKGGATAQALVTGGPQAVAAVNSLQAQIGAAADQLGNVAAVNMYGTGAQAADGFIAGLEADMAKLDKAASRIARQLVKAIKRELKIKSPSKVARELSRRFTDGLVLQTYVDGSRVRKAGAFTAKALQEGFSRPQLTADAIANGSRSRKFKGSVELTADALTELELGRKVRVALDAIGGVGG